MEEYLQLMASNAYMIYLYIIIISIISYIITRLFIVKLLTYLFNKSSNTIDDILIEKGLFNRLSYLVPLIIFYNLYHYYIGNSIFVNRSIKSLFIILINDSSYCIQAYLDQSNSRPSSRSVTISFVRR